MVVTFDHQGKPRRYPVLSTKHIGVLPYLLPHVIRASVLPGIKSQAVTPCPQNVLPGS